MIEGLLLIIMSLITIVCALCVVFQKNPIYSSIFLIQTMVSLAVVYVLLHAEFIAAVQVMVYAGAIMVLFIFVIMLLNLSKKDVEEKPGQIVSSKTFCTYHGPCPDCNDRYCNGEERFSWY